MHDHDGPVRSEEVLAHGPVQWASAGTEIVLHVPVLGATAVLDPTSALLWQCLDGVTPLAELFADLADAFEVPTEQVAADCLPAVQSWLASGAVQRVSSASVADGTDAVDRPRYLVHPPDT